MDIGSVIGLVLVYFFVIMAMVTSSSVGIYIDFPSFLLVVMGTVGVMFTAFPFPVLMQGIRATMKAFIYSSQSQSELIAQLVEFAVRARRDGILSLESSESEMRDEFLRKGIRLAVDGTEPEIIRTILETDLELMEERHKIGRGLLDGATDIAPAMGMIGTLVGLIAMLQSMDDPSAIGPAMSMTLITTLYGAMIATMTTIPISTRLTVRSSEEQVFRRIMIAGIMSIQAGDNPRIVEQKLNAYLPPSLRQTQFD